MKKFMLTAAIAAFLAGSNISMDAENINIGNGTYNFTREVDRTIAPGVKYTYFKATGRGTYGTHVYVTEVDLTNPDVKIEYLTANNTMGGSVKSLANIAKANTTTGHTVVAGANANFWITSEQPWKSQLSQMPHGTAVSKGTMYSVNPSKGSDAHMGGPHVNTGSIAIASNGRAYIRRFIHQFNAVNLRIGHSMDLTDMNRVVEGGTASIYTPAYGRTKAFKPVTKSGDVWTIVEGQSTEILCDLKPGQKHVAGDDTYYIIKEIRTNAGTGTLGDHDLAIVGRDSYATVPAQNWKVGDEVKLEQHFLDLETASTEVIPDMMNATSGNVVTMEAGSILTDVISGQAGYNNTNYARTLYATNNDGTKLWILVCGNKTGTYYGMTTTQMTYMAKYLGATYASQVDCGGSSQMYVDGSQVNQSTDAANVRSVQSGIFVVSTAAQTVQPPTLTTTAVNTDFGALALGGSKSVSFSVTGANLTGDITISLSGAGASQFSVTPTTILQANQKGTITVTYAPKAAGSHSATLSIATPGVTAKTLTLTGNANAVAGAKAIYQDDALAYGVSAPDSYTLEREYQDFPIAQLAGTTVKRVIARGDYLYILAHKDNTPVIVIFNHTTKTVLRTLGTENATIGTPCVNDIAITAEGILVGLGKATQTFGGDGLVLSYRWSQDENGLPYGQPYHWNISNVAGNWSNGIFGESITHIGTIYQGGKFVYTAQSAANSNVRLSYQNLNGNMQIGSALHNNLNSASGYKNTKDIYGDLLLFPSPFSDNKVILNGTLKSGNELTLSSTAAGVPTVGDAFPSFIPATAVHTSMFRYGGKIYMVSPDISGSNNTGVILADITSGLAKGTKVSLSTSAMDAAPTTNVATVGTGVITMDGDKFVEARMALLAVRNGAVTKFITPTSIQGPVIDEPVVISNIVNTDFGSVTVGQKSTRTFTIESANLTEDIKLSVSGEGFAVNPSTVAKNSDPSTFEVSFNPASKGTKEGTLTISTAGVPTMIYTLTGKGRAEDAKEGDRGVYAHSLSSKFTDNGFIFSFTLTGDAPNVRINLYEAKTRTAGTRPLATLDLGALPAGQHSHLAIHNEIPQTVMHWEVEVENNPVEKGGKIFHWSPAKADCLGGVAVVTDPESPVYGRIVVSSGFAQGFQLFTPDFELIETNVPGGEQWSASNRSSAYRLAMREGNIAYAIDYADDGAGIYILNPEHPEYGTSNIFSGTKDAGGCWTLNGVALGGGGSGLCFTGSGAETKLWSFQEDYPAGNNATHYICRYDIGTNGLITMAPTHFEALYGTEDFAGILGNNNVNLTPDGTNGIFISQMRGSSNTTSTPAFIYIDLNGKILYNSGTQADIIPACGSGIALSADRKLLAVSLGKSGIRVYNVTWADNGAPQLTVRCDIPESANGNSYQVPQLAFDAANNILAYQRNTDASLNGLNVYAMPQEGDSFATSAPMVHNIDGTMTGVDNITIDTDNAETAPVYYDIKGVRVDGDNLRPGLYLKVTGKTVEKIRIR